MKKLLIIAAACVLLFGCEGKEDSSFSGFSVKRVGEENYGFIDVPENWELYEDEVLKDGNVIQYTDPDGYNVITMQFFDDSDAVTSALNLGTLLEDSVEELTSAVVEFGGCKAYQLGGYAVDSRRIMACWIFDGNDGYTHVVSIESNDESVLALCDTYLQDK